jgi:hypothetical protein
VVRARTRTECARARSGVRAGAERSASGRSENGDV